MEVSSQIYPRGKSPLYPLDRLDGSQSLSGRGGKEKISLLLLEIESQSSSPFLISNELPVTNLFLRNKQ